MEGKGRGRGQIWENRPKSHRRNASEKRKRKEGTDEFKDRVKTRGGKKAVRVNREPLRGRKSRARLAGNGDGRAAFYKARRP